jgi:hypothetical protein
MKDVEQLLFKEFRNKAILVSPNSMHKHFEIQGLDYDDRKIRVTEIVDEMLKTNPLLHEKFQSLVRQHDIGDAGAHLKKFLAEKHKEHQEEIIRQRFKRKLDLSQFVFRPEKKSKYFQK